MVRRQQPDRTLYADDSRVYYSELPTPFGLIGVYWRDQQLIRVLLAPELPPKPWFAPVHAPKPQHKPAPSEDAMTQQARLSPRQLSLSRQPLPLTAEAPAWLRAELDAYFADPGYRFSCHIEPSGTVFQQRVWTLLAAIPPGNPLTYGALATLLGSSPRAIGNACRANPLPLRIPCHRVVAANGLGGFAGDRSGRLLAIKRWLLDHEAGLSPDHGAATPLSEQDRRP
ncbi:MAG: methylated-DNA--[protein]-cysteine S-methyltransferase [Lamprobacter sp.]|uniref:methylated-DNA--[protein]-cysteine S-methyltransferase n=1 Tax=Lamprobacter sp. TaxID=3100796 RepID=UPI002B257EF2|nr:methylated-DNA--[protein]-cysteine S-methyltransferase [Lamprobacter sp.]MEA3638841.1 methylated-DNA--[protein]-cysteine S-methyltransferase [Lamprobacter sp.]